MKNPTAEVLSNAVQAHRDGTKQAEILAEFDLSHSQFEFALLRANFPDLVGSVEFSPANVVALREYFQISWGRIAVLCDQPESAVRKSYKEAAGVLSQGIRIGKGGRWFLNERELYTDGLQKPGTRITEAEVKAIGSTRQAALISATEQKLIHKAPAELKEIAKAEGVKLGAKATKAQMVKAIVKARQG